MFGVFGQDVNKKNAKDTILPNVVYNSYSVPESIAVKFSSTEDTTIYKVALGNNINGSLRLDKSGSWFENNAPWVIAGGISIVTLIISSLLALLQGKLTKDSMKNDMDISNQNIKSSIINANRQEWINKLRDTSAEYIASILMYDTEYERQTNGLGYDPEKITKLLNTVISKSFQIELLLNPIEPKSVLINNCMNEINKLAFNISKVAINNENYLNGTDEFNSHIDNYKVTIKQILKEEWERVKNIDNKK